MLQDKETYVELPKQTHDSTVTRKLETLIAKYAQRMRYNLLQNLNTHQVTYMDSLNYTRSMN